MDPTDHTDEPRREGRTEAGFEGRPPANGEPEAPRSGLTAQQAESGRPGHPEESPKTWGKFVTIAAIVVIALAVVIAIF